MKHQVVNSPKSTAVHIPHSLSVNRPNSADHTP